MPSKYLRTILSLLLAVAFLLTACGGAATPTAAPAQPEPTKPPEPTEPPAPEPTQPPAEAPTAAPATTEGKTLLIAVSGDIAGWDPAASIYWLANEVIINTHDTLVDYKPGTDDAGNAVRKVGDFAPSLAESWDVSPDGQKFTFHLIKNAKFHNGDPLNAQAVKDSFARILAIPGLAQFLLADVAFVKSADQIVVDDEYTVTFNLPQPNPIFLKVLQEMNMVIVNAAQIAKEGGEGDAGLQWAANNPTGTGPYVLDKFTPGEELVLKADPNYWGAEPEFTTVIYKIVPSAENRLLLLNNGDVDMVYEIPLKDFGSLKDNPNISAYATPTFGNLYMELGRNLPPWDNPKLRQAIAYAIPYETIINEVTYGFAKPAPSWVPVGLEGFIPASPYKYDLEKAAALLKEAGHEGGKGLPPVTFYLKQGVPEEEQAAVYIQAELAKLGITMDIQPLSLAAHSEQLQKHELPFTFNFWIPYVPDPVYHLYWNFLTTDSGCCNYTSFSNARMDEIIKAGLIELDPAKRDKLVEEAQQILVEDPPQIALYHPTWNLAMKSSIKGYTYYPDTLLRFAQLSTK